MRFKKLKYSPLTAIAFAVLSILSFSCDKQPIGPTGPDPVGPPVPGQYMSFTEFRALHTAAEM